MTNPNAPLEEIFNDIDNVRDNTRLLFIEQLEAAYREGFRNGLHHFGEDHSEYNHKLWCDRSFAGSHTNILIDYNKSE